MFKKNALTVAEADLAQLTKRGAGLVKRRDEAAATLTTAASERRRLLTETDDPSAADLAKADRAVRDATDARDAALDALAAVEVRAAETRATIERLKDEAERERSATAIEASAKAADAAIERVRRAVGELDSARRDLASALLPEAVRHYDPPSNSPAFGPTFLTTIRRYDHRGEPEVDTLDVEEVASRVLGHLITGTMPTLGIARLEDVQRLHMDGQPTRVLAPVDGDVARSLITDPMRAAAARAREGIAEAPLPGTKPPRRRADGWTTDVEARSFDKAGVPVTPSGFYLDEGEAEQFQPHPPMPVARSRTTAGEAA